MSFEADYIDLVDAVLIQGQRRTGRNGKTRALFGESIELNELSIGLFPLLTQRRIYYKGVLGELAAFVRGATLLADFKKWGCNYWDDNAKAWSKNHNKSIEDMEIGQIYGAQWTNWEKTGYNQLAALVHGLEHSPHSRRHVLTSYSPIAEACLPSCHLLAQFFVNDGNSLDCQVYMRSVDLILGLPSDVVLYSALLLVLSGSLGMSPGSLIFSFGDAHVYEGHVETYKQYQRGGTVFHPPSYEVLEANSIFDFEPKHLQIHNYDFNTVVSYDLYA